MFLTVVSVSSGVIGSTAQLESNSPMGIEEVDEDFPPAPPPAYKAVTGKIFEEASNLWQIYNSEFKVHFTFSISPLTSPLSQTVNKLNILTKA